ncbi:MAG: zinc ribbon domain-containing protein, partial [Burkholderiaceae bacterium]|nr:zinc ribbon domain-containing protein [Burkholderiaceae bacterium]
MSFAHSTGKLSTQCPYCEHVSPEGSKFCNECGAALHLRPCAHCGALNDVSLVEACGRCGESFSAPSAPSELEPTAAAAGAASADLVSLEAEMPAQPSPQHFDALGPREDEPSLLPTALSKSSQPSWRAALALLILIVGGGTVFLINRQPAASASAQGTSAVAQPAAISPAIDTADKEVRAPVFPNDQPNTQPGDPVAANITPSPRVEASTLPAVLPASPRNADSAEAVTATPASAPAQRRRPGLVSSNGATPSPSFPSRAALPSAPTSAGP